MKIRIKFRKYGVMRFIGHLDIMRYFQKAIRRAEIDIRYSEGFSPHQIMSFASPLGVGLTSDGEYLDIEVHSTRSTEESLAALNGVMVEGMECTEYKLLPDTAKNAMSVVAAADYRLSFKEEYIPAAATERFLSGITRFFFEPSEVPVIKQTKKGEKVLDLKKLVHEFYVRDIREKPVFFLMLSAGSSENVKPELVLHALFDFMGLAYEEDAIWIHRQELYAAGENGFLPLGAMGTDITN